MKHLVISLVLFFISTISPGQITNRIPDQIDSSVNYMFYLHGAIVQNQGENAVSSYFGPYLYRTILDSLASYGYHVISERRPKGTKEEDYAKVVADQIRKLILAGVPEKQISVVGASQGAWIALETTLVLQNDQFKYVLLGICNEYNTNYFLKHKTRLCGNFLSIYESTDQKKSCDKLLDNDFCKTGYEEVMLNMGNNHGFLYQPYPEWVSPMMEWLATK